MTCSPHQEEDLICAEEDLICEWELRYACERGDLATVKTLCKKVKVEHVRVWGRTSIHYAAA